jgi:hypothetical protein
MLFSMAVPRAGELVAEVSAADAEGRSEVEREGMRDVIVKSWERAWRRCGCFAAAKMRFTFAMARSLMKSWAEEDLRPVEDLSLWSSGKDSSEERPQSRGLPYVALEDSVSWASEACSMLVRRATSAMMALFDSGSDKEIELLYGGVESMRERMEVRRGGRSKIQQREASDIPEANPNREQ